MQAQSTKTTRTTQKKRMKKPAKKKSTAKKASPKKTKKITSEESKKMTFQGLKYRWYLKEPNDDTIQEISKTHNISKPIAHTLFSRDMTNAEEVRSFLFSTFEQDVADSRLLKDVDIAVERILKAIENKEKILIFGDYDVDGATSSSLMLLGLIPLGANINYFLPNRKKDGYGLSSKFVKKAVENGYHLIITVDNGITAHKPAEDAKKLGIDLIITDHHRQLDTLPNALAVINPNRNDCNYPFKSLAGVGVAFKLISLIYDKLGKTLPDKVYELLMLGTVADVVPLMGENRFWVKNGLSKINRQKSLAVRVLAENSRLTKARFSSLDIGFMIAPQINALGRLDDSREAVRFLISSDQKEVQRIGRTLKTMNEERKRIDREIYQQIEHTIINGTIDLNEENIIMAGNTKWPAGVIGLVAGKLSHNFGRPTLLFHIDEKQGVAKGSCRSIPEFNIFNALQECSDLLIKFGGHSFAAGLALKKENLPEFKHRLEEIVARDVDPDDLQPKITLDAYLDLEEANGKLFSDLERLEPFGNQNPQPTFLALTVPDSYAKTEID